MSDTVPTSGLQLPLSTPLGVGVPADTAPAWDYATAFSRNLGLVSDAEQDRLRNARVAIAGMGGVGGVHAVTLARLGIGRFHVADRDRFEVGNFNRQAGATTATVGHNKAQTMADQIRQINPESDVRVWNEFITEDNIDDFLSGCDVVLDGIDFFSIRARRLLFAEARRRGLWVVTAGPIGFSTAWLVFDPEGMSFDEYFDLRDDQTEHQQLAGFAVGLTPRATHLSYIDLRRVDLGEARGPSLSLACQLASGVAAAEVVKILLGRGTIRPAPWYHQFDAYRLKYRTGKLWFGNKGPWQRIKRHVIARKFTPHPSPLTPQTSNLTPQTSHLTPHTSHLSKLAAFLPLVVSQNIGRQKLQRTPEPKAVTDDEANVLAYDQVMTTGLAIPYAIGLETIYRARSEPFGGRALDLACGPGHFSLLMAKHLRLDELIGVDLSRPMIDTATKNAKLKGIESARFELRDITNLDDYADNTFDLTTFCDAAHHFDSLEQVRSIVEEMDRITCADGVVFVMDLVRLRTKEITEKYVKLVGADYHTRGLSAFYEDLYHSMFAAWTADEFRAAIPQSSTRTWHHIVPKGLPALQMLVGIPATRSRLRLRRGLPWSKTDCPVPKSLRSDWMSVRLTTW